jgi:hypothetical protein
VALTRITNQVISANALSADKIANATIVSRHLADLSVELRHLAADANTTSDLSGLQGNVIRLQNNLESNVNTVQDNVAGVETRRVANIAGAVSTITTADLTASRALESTVGGKVGVSSVTSTELGYVSGVTSAIQTQLDTKDSVANVHATYVLLNANINTVTDNLVTAQTVAHANDFATYIGLNANIDVVSSNTDAVEARRAANLVSATFTGQVNMSDDLVVAGNLIVNGDTTTSNSINMVVEDRILMLANSATGTPTGDIGILFNRGNEGNAAFFYDESATTFKLADTRDPSSNTELQPITLSNLTLSKLSYDGTDLSTAIVDNRSGAISSVYASDLTASRALASDGSGKISVATTTLTELNYVNGVTSAIQTQLDTKDSVANVHATFVLLDANINTVTDNLVTAQTVAHANDFATFTRLNANINTVTDNLVTAQTVAHANDFATFTRLNANLNTVSANVEIRNTQLNANIDVVQDNVAVLGGGGTFFKPFMNVNTAAGTSNVFFVGQNTTSDDNVLTVTLDGIVQSNSEFVMHHANDTIQFKDASIPSGVVVTILSMIGVA